MSDNNKNNNESYDHLSKKMKQEIEERNDLRAKAVAEVFANHPWARDVVARARTETENDDRFGKMKKKIEELSVAIMEKYRSTPATAKQCLKEFDRKLLALGMEPDCVVEWQVLNNWVEEEDEWDSLTAEEQAGRENVPKGKQRKTKNDDSFDEMFKEIEELSDAIMEKYRSTPATAKQCLKDFERQLAALGVDDDCVSMWQVLYGFAMEEDVWDSLTAEEQASRDVPKGKKRKQQKTKA